VQVRQEPSVAASKQFLHSTICHAGLFSETSIPQTLPVSVETGKWIQWQTLDYPHNPSAMIQPATISVDTMTVPGLMKVTAHPATKSGALQ